MEVYVPKETKTDEQWKQKVERELDRQLEDTFPASDPLKITRRPPKKPLGSPAEESPKSDETEN
jgi:hypothetical protein